MTSARRTFPLLPALAVLGVVGWVGTLAIGLQLWLETPTRAGLDLNLLLDAARRVLDGQSPYAPALLAGTAPDAASLFYSYPPPVAQVLTLTARLPDGVVLLLWGAGAVAGLALVAAALARAVGGASPARAPLAALAAVLAAPLVLPLSVALLFGNLDVWYPLAYGALVLAALPGASRRTMAAGGIAVAAVTIAKLHPVTLAVWVMARAWSRRNEPGARATAVAMLAAGLVIAGLSLAVGGTGPWLDYASVVRAAAGAGLVDPRNVGPVSLLGQAVGISAPDLVLVQAVVAGAALVAAAVAGFRVRDGLLGVAIAASVSLVVLPVTWYHYPVALLPVGIALALRHPASRPRLLAAVVIADVAIAAPPFLWLAVGLVLVEAVIASGAQPDAPATAERPPPGDRTHAVPEP